MNLYNSDCLIKLKKLESESIDALVTDPPAGIAFMNKEWDKDKGGRDNWIEWMQSVMTECYRVLKPGAHGLVWALPRTSHWTATALENAGFEVRDVITHLFGQGFPKSLDVSKAIDKASGAKRERVPIVDISTGKVKTPNIKGGVFNGSKEFTAFSNEAVTNEAKQWQGWGTALKPASEHWILIRKPISEKTVAKNVLKHGTGAINIDGSRIQYVSEKDLEAVKKNIALYEKSNNKNSVDKGWKNTSKELIPNDPSKGRFPANLVLSHSEYCTDSQCDIECAIQILDKQSGITRPGHFPKSQKTNSPFNQKECNLAFESNNGHGDTGGASRFFYCAKISKSERNQGLDGMPKKKNDFQRESSGLSKSIKGRQGIPDNSGQPNENHHPTVKPKKLMSYLIKLITPPQGTVLDPFMGSGSTGIAAKENGFKFIGIEKEKEYFEIARKRIEAVL